MRNKRLLRHLRILYRRDQSEYTMLGGATWTEESWAFNWFGGRRALWVTRKTHALEPKASYEIKFTLRGDWTIIWSRAQT